METLPVAHASSRLEAYSDAIFSIIATIMILPISHTEIEDGEDLSTAFIHDILPKTVVYMFTFLVVCNYWSAHVWIFETIKQVDEFLVLLNSAFMMFVTFLPFTFTLLGTYPKERLAIWLFCGTLILVGLCQVTMIYYAFRHRDILHEEVKHNADWKSHRNGMYALVLSPVCIAILSSCLVFASTLAADICLLLILWGNFLRRMLVKIFHRISGILGTQQLEIHFEDSIRTKLMHQRVTKERIIGFSDGVFAIVATLVILDICENNVPTEADIKKFHGLANALSQYSAIFLTYSGTFITVALLWYVHHSLLHYLKELNKLMVIFNDLCLLSIGGMPLAFKLACLYHSQGHGNFHNEVIAIQLNCFAIFMGSIFQAAIWVTALFNQDDYVNKDGRFRGKDHPYMTAKVAVYPLVSLSVYLVNCFANSSIQIEVFNSMQIGALGLFVLLYCVYWAYMRSIRNRVESIQIDENNVFLRDDDDDQSENSLEAF